MLERTRYILAFCILLISPAYCQKFQYGGMQQLSLNFNERSTNMGFTMVNGLRFHRFFTGLGVDAQFNGNYFSANPFNTSAVYADGRYYINKKKNFFGKLNGGVNLINEKLGSTVAYRYKKLAGYYGAIGLGFKARIGKEVFYTFDVNYCIRQTRFNYKYLNFLNQWQTDKYDLRQFGILVNMGIEIF